MPCGDEQQRPNRIRSLALYIGVAGRLSLGVGGRPCVDPVSKFTDWVRPHWSAMTGLASRLADPCDVEDVVQEALTAAWRLRDRFDPSRGSPRAWLLALTADHARRSRRWAVNSTAVSLHDTDPPTTTDQPADVDLRRAIDVLPGRQRLAVALYYYLDLPVAEVAAVMGCSSGTVKSTLADARRRLRTALGDGDG